MSDLQRDEYEALKAYGHSPAKAAEIVLCARRGDYFCERYIAFVQQSTSPPNPGSQ